MSPVIVYMSGNISLICFGCLPDQKKEHSEFSSQNIICKLDALGLSAQPLPEFKPCFFGRLSHSLQHILKISQHNFTNGGNKCSRCRPYTLYFLLVREHHSSGEETADLTFSRKHTQFDFWAEK